MEERPWSFDGDGHLFRPVFTKRLCNVFADELDRFPKGAGFPGGKLPVASMHPHSRKPAATRSLTHLKDT